MFREIPELVHRLEFHSDRMEEQGHITAARWMREAAGEIVYLRCLLDALVKEKRGS